MRARLGHLPFLLAGLRLVLALALWWPALAGAGRALAAGLALALATDVLDGYAARRLGRGDAAFSRFDSLADKALMLSVLGWLLLLHPAIVWEQPALALASLLLSLGSWLAGLIGRGRVIGLHLPLAKLAGAAQAAFVLHTLWGGAYSPALLWLAGGLLCLAAAQEIVVQLARPQAGGAARAALRARR